MNTPQEDYQHIIEQHQIQHTYSVQAEKIVVEAFLSLDDDSKARFFDFLKQIYPEKSQIYRFFYTQYTDLRVGRQVLSKHHKRYLLTVMLPFLSKENKFYVLLCEILDYIQTKKNILTYRGRHTVTLHEFFDIIKSYYDLIAQLDKMPSIWFHEKSYQKEDRNEILTTVRYIYLKKIQIGLKNMQHDLQTITEQKNYLPALFHYFVYMLGVEVEISKKNITFPYIYLPFVENLPEPKGAFTDLLQHYLIEELAIIEKETQEKEMYKSVFARDLPASFAHYKNSRLPTNRVEGETVLQASAGVFKFNIKRKKIIEKTIYATLSITGLLALTASPIKGAIVLGVTFLVWLMALAGKFLRNIHKKQQSNHHKKTEIIKIQLEKYRVLIEERREELSYIYMRDNLLDKIKDSFYWRIKQRKLSIYADDVHYDPLDILNLYKKYADYIQNIPLQNIDILYAFSTSDEDKIECMEVMRYLFMQKLKKSYLSFINLADYMIDGKLKFKYYMFFIDKECAIISDILASFYTDINGSGGTPKKIVEYEKVKRKINALFIHLDSKKIVQNIQNKLLREWVDFEMQEISQNNIKEEYKKLEAFIKLRTKNKYFTKINQNTLILEGQEGILFFTR